jgi:hypothetical protein
VTNANSSHKCKFTHTYTYVKTYEPFNGNSKWSMNTESRADKSTDIFPREGSSDELTRDTMCSPPQGLASLTPYRMALNSYPAHFLSSSLKLQLGSHFSCFHSMLGKTGVELESTSQHTQLHLRFQHLPHCFLH